jgi:hypothetical protein
MFTFDVFYFLFFDALCRNNGDVQKTVVEIYNKHKDPVKMDRVEFLSKLPPELSVEPIHQFSKDLWSRVMTKLSDVCPLNWLPFVESVETTHKDKKRLFFLTDFQKLNQTLMVHYDQALVKYRTDYNLWQHHNNQFPNNHPPPQPPTQPQYYSYSFDPSNVTDIERWLCIACYLSISPLPN